MSARACDVLIVGGGVFGATAALALRRRGRSVVLVDPGPLPHPDASSTDISKVVRADYGGDAFYTELMERALPRWSAWNDAWGEALYHETGFVLLTEGPMEEGSFEAESHRTLVSRGHALERLDAAAIRARFPCFAEGVYSDGYFNPLGGWAESGRVVAALLEEARREGVELREGEAVESLEGASRVEGVRTRREVLRGGEVVVAAGAWTASLVPELAAMLRPVAQPVLHFRPSRPERFAPPALVPFGADISRTGWYGFCATPSGVVKIAHHGPGQALDPRAERRVPAGAEARFRSFLSRSIPELAEAPKVGERLCLYCDTSDGDLLIDRHPGRAGLTIAAGGSGHAFKLAPLLGDLVAEALERETPPRFAWRGDEGRAYGDAARFFEGSHRR